MLNTIGYVRALELRYLELRNVKLRSEDPAMPGFQLVFITINLIHKNLNKYDAKNF